MNPIISVVIPVYNGQAYLERTISAIQNQTFQNFEVIFVDDASTDDSLIIMEQACAADDRFSVFCQSHAGAGASRNRGLSVAKGEYVLFSDCDDIYKPEFLEKMYHTASVHKADITACNFIGIQKNGKEIMQTGVSVKWLLNNESVFHYKDCPSNILRIIGTNVWNKLYRKVFLLEHGLQFDELLTCNDLSFAAVSTVMAERITYVEEHLLSYHFPRQNNRKNPLDVCAAIESTVHQLSRTARADVLQPAIIRFVIENYIKSLKRDVKDFFAAESEYLYQTAHKCFHTALFSALQPESLNNGPLYREFCTVQKHDYKTMCKLIQKKLIVSLTTYPRRIHAVAQVVESLCAQSRKPNEIILWLAESQFPKKELDLPEELLGYVERKCLTIRWCDDLKSHKKYFYAFKEFRDDLVITVDDDIIYSSTTIDTLYKSYLLYPDAVSTIRGHLMLVSEENEILPYNKWIQETVLCAHKPSMQLFATGVAGVLYSPNLFLKDFYDRDAIMRCCPLADDLWLKAMQLASDVPVVISGSLDELQYIPGTQENALCNVNVKQGQNDVQLQQIIQWMDSTLQPGMFIHKLLHTNVGVKIVGIEDVSALINAERQQARNRFLSASRKLSAVETTLLDTEKSLRKTECDLQKMECSVENLTHEKKQIELHLEEVVLQRKNMDVQLQKIKEKLDESEKSRPIREQLKLAGKALDRPQKSPRPAALLVKYAIYYLAWIPEKMLEIMMYYLQNGATQTLKQIYRKLFRRGQ